MSECVVTDNHFDILTHSDTLRHTRRSDTLDAPTHSDASTLRHSDTPTHIDTTGTYDLSRGIDTAPTHTRHSPRHSSTLRHSVNRHCSRHCLDTAPTQLDTPTLRQTRAQGPTLPHPDPAPACRIQTQLLAARSNAPGGGATLPGAGSWAEHLAEQGRPSERAWGSPGREGDGLPRTRSVRRIDL